MNKSIITDTMCFSAADILLPREDDLQRWAVIACDQFTSQPDYWAEVKRLTENRYSAYHLILPEAELGLDTTARTETIHETMLQYLNGGYFRIFPDSFIYTERTLMNGEVRRGLLGKVDLERYDYTGSRDSEVRATEETVTERIPPRMSVRRNAALELPHVLLLCDDDRYELIEPLAEVKEQLTKLYEFNLMLDGGHVAGWLVTGREKESLLRKIAEYEKYEQQKHIGKKLVYAVGDGNHSLATAKACYEELKERNPGLDIQNHPARYALCELNNIHDPSQTFEPIHRLIKKCNAEKLICDMNTELGSADGIAIPWMSGVRKGVLRVSVSDGRLPLAILQAFLDRWLTENSGELDYIHGAETLRTLSESKENVGFLLPAPQKESLFPGILSGGVLPRKTFSMGEAEEKRYYLEARKIL